ncbi:putative transcription factor C2H2 family [Helianthus annuus]|nr:putative transcription factor C2H2 family [Helianthus annuus]KAJ0471629.1 putative transcription factor C2H2 family [Helianthus annuus]
MAINSFSFVIRHKCAACFQQFKKKEHLVAHMKKSHHSVHQPKCGVCQKHCKSFESLREHISGPLAKAQCSSIFSQYGCQLCMKVFESPISLGEHKDQCILTAPDCLVSCKLIRLMFLSNGPIGLCFISNKAKHVKRD